MVSLIAKTPAEGQEPVEIGAARLSEVFCDALTSIAPFDGKERAASAALQKATGAKFPAPNRTTGKPGARAIWFGRGQAMFIGSFDVGALGQLAAITDQSDAWAALRLEGDAAEEVLARLTPLDLRAREFKPGQTARSDLQHMMASVTRTGIKSFEIIVMRSMARTAWHEIEAAMRRVAAKAKIAAD